MALLAEVEEAKLPEERPPRGVQLVVLSETVKRTAPILGASKVALWVVGDKLKVEVTHRESMRTFKAELTAEDLEQSGFDTRDSAEECVALIVDVLSAEESDTVAVTPMASPLEGSDTDTASIKVPFSECEFLRISFSIKMRTKLYEYSFVALEQKLDAATRTQLQLQSLKQMIEAQKAEIEMVKATMEERMKTMVKAEMKTVMETMKEKMEAMLREIATQKSKGIASFRSNAMVGRFRKWNEEVLAPTLDAMGALSEDQSEFRIGIEGVYRVLTKVGIGGDTWGDFAFLDINGTRKCVSYAGKRTGTVLCFVGRLRVGDTVKVHISANEQNVDRYNWLQIEKLC